MRPGPVPALVALTALAALLLVGDPTFATPGDTIVFASDRALDRVAEIFTVPVRGGTRVDVSRSMLPDSWPAWSPDGAKIAFLRRGAIVVAGADGGRPRAFSAGVNDPPLSWSPDGRRILFKGGVLSVADGKIRAFDTGDRPVWSPDGRRIAFEVGNAVYVANADGTGRRRLASGNATIEPAWSPDGRRIAFGSLDGGIWVVGRDGRGLTAVDRPGAGRQLAYTAPSWAPDGGRVVYARAESHSPEVVVGRADGKGTLRLLPGTDPVWSRNGRWIAFVGVHPRNPASPDQLYAVHPDGLGRRQLTRHQGVYLVQTGSGVQALSWSPDGRRIAYSAYLLVNDLELYAMRPDGSGTRELTANDVDDLEPHLSPDGSQIAFVRAGRPSLSQAEGSLPSGRLLVMPAGGGPARSVATHADSPGWSPDGTRIVFARLEADGSSSIALANADGRNARALLPGYQPAWSFDGSEIAFVRRDADAGLRIVRADGSGVTRLVDETAVKAVNAAIPAVTRFRDPSWSPDGRISFFVDYLDGQAHRRSAAFLVNRDGSGLRASPFLADLSPVAWSPDGTRVATAYGEGIYVAAADGSALHRLTGDWIQNRDPDWGPRR